ncbi:MAG TPA: ABC transporter substrate-binding protein [Methanotrichaceae archaeon]|nr:ABC transporter substrate-binding protein [Methanotrichaceae archaeon]HQF17245.1 ABC transporter substrate-binding protein [Methanotrichaceae archaeon]HQI91818.1 ABC transporter substrate-binding protein [Methanotrichaceae archaeon]
MTDNRMSMPIIVGISMVLSLIGISMADYEPIVYGDANNDGLIDPLDIDYVDGIVKGINERTELSDANYDGKIDEADILQIKRIINGNQTKLTLLDMDGRSVTIPQPVDRVLGIGFGFIENTMFAFGVEDKIVGSGGAVRSDMTAGRLIPELDELPNAGSPVEGINYETIASANPEIVIVRKSVYFPEQTDKAVKMVEKMDIPVIVLKDPNHFHTSDVTTIYQEISLLGKIFNKEESAQHLIDEMAKRVSFIRERTENIGEEDKPKVLFCGLGSNSTRDKGGVLVVWAKECASTFAELINIKSAYEGTGRNILSAEHALNLNPDVIILETSGGGWNISQLYNEDHYKNIQEIKAIRDKRVHSVGKLTYCGDIQLELPIMLMIEAKGTYPERFSDINVSEWIEKYYKDIYKLDVDSARILKEVQGLAWIDSSGF